MPEPETKDAPPPDYTSGYAERLLGEDAKAPDSKAKSSNDDTLKPRSSSSQTTSPNQASTRAPHNLASPPTYLTSAAPPPDYARSTGPPSNRPAASKPKTTTDSIGQPISRLSSLMPPPPPDAPEDPKDRSFRARIKRWTSGESWGEQETEEWRQSGRRGEDRGTRAEFNYYGVGLSQFGGPFSKRK